MDQELLTPQQVAERLHVTERTVYRWLTEGRLRGVKLGRLWRISAGELDTFLREEGGGRSGTVGYELPSPAARAGEVREGAPGLPIGEGEISDEDWAWLRAGAEDQARALAAVESEIPPEELAEFLRDLHRRVVPIRWNPSKGVFEEVVR